MKAKFILMCSMVALLLGLTGCSGCSRKEKSSGSIKCDGIQSKVQKVIDGNTIELKNGLKVELLGIKPTEHTKKYLEKHVQNETIIVIADSKQKQYIKTYKTKIKAYVKVKGERLCISGKMLLDKTAELRQTAVKDSLQSFREKALYENRRAMSLPELHTYLKDRTFKIQLADGSSGTGFFINDNGLALTNNHVFDGSQAATILFFGENGTINTANTRSAGDIVKTYTDNHYIDFTIFYVNLISGEKVKYIPLIRQHEKEGEKLAKLGSPLREAENFQDGTLSTYYNGFFTHNCGTGHGDSGGPVVNMKGEVVGINQSGEQDYAQQPDGSIVIVPSKIVNAVDAVLIRDFLDENEIAYGR